MKALILMTRLSDYMLNSFRTWQEASGVDLHVVRRRVDNAEAPFDFSQTLGGISFYERESMDDAAIETLVRDIQPNLIICFGWADRGYLRAVRRRPDSTSAVMTMDNQWCGTFRQTLGLVWSRVWVTGIFDYIWVPGQRQRRFAKLLGFRDEQIREGLYVANAANFLRIRDTYVGPPAKRLVFVGRYVDAKGLRELWQGFISYHERTVSNLELVCIGSGPCREAAPAHPRIRHLGFIQPKNLADVLKGGGIFILPSRYEPWGLVVHEFAIAGFPLVLSKQVGAADRFLGNDNGFLLAEVTPDAIARVIAAVDKLDPQMLAAMSQASAAKAADLSVDAWCAQANAFMTTTSKGGD